MSLFQPIGQKRLTNIAVVRLKAAGQRFEVACYKNKIVSWRDGVEKDIDEVLQSRTVYSNVSKGILARDEDLKKAFKSVDHAAIAVQILNAGEYQVSERERELHLDAVFKDVANIVAEKCRNPETRRPYPASMIERAMKSIHFAADAKRSAKQQALELIPQLQKAIQIERAPMRLRLSLGDVGSEAELRSIMESVQAQIEHQDRQEAETAVICQVPPSSFRLINNMARSGKHKISRVDVVDFAVFDDRDETGAGQAGVEEDGNGAAENDRNRLSGGKDGSAAPLDDAAERASRGGSGPADAAHQRSADSDTHQKKKKSFSCKACLAEFPSPQEHREHFKSDWHRVNLQRKVRGEEPLSIEEAMVESMTISARDEFSL